MQIRFREPDISEYVVKGSVSGSEGKVDDVNLHTLINLTPINLNWLNGYKAYELIYVDARDDLIHTLYFDSIDQLNKALYMVRSLYS